MPSLEECSVGHTLASPPVMPRRVLAQEELDALYPSFSAPEELALQDYARHCDDAAYQHGLNIAKEIQNDVGVHGRRRHVEELSAEAKDIEKHKNDADNNMSPIVSACLKREFFKGIPPVGARRCCSFGRMRGARMNPSAAPLRILPGIIRQSESDRCVLSAQASLSST